MLGRAVGELEQRGAAHRDALRLRRGPAVRVPSGARRGAADRGVRVPWPTLARTSSRASTHVDSASPPRRHRRGASWRRRAASRVADDPRRGGDAFVAPARRGDPSRRTRRGRSDHHGVVREWTDLDEVGLGEERLRLVGEQDAHRRRLRPGKDESRACGSDAADESAALRLRVARGDAGELVEDDDQWMLLPRPERGRRAASRTVSSGSGRCGAATRKLDTDDAQVQRERSGDPRRSLAQQPLAPLDGPRSSAPATSATDVNLVEVDPDDADPGSFDDRRPPGATRWSCRSDAARAGR